MSLLRAVVAVVIAACVVDCAAPAAAPTMSARAVREIVVIAMMIVIAITR